MTDSCSVELLESAMAGSLPPHGEALLDRHLVECAECSAALERMAGGPAWCEETALFLAGDEFDDALPARDDCSEVDFSVEHLEPSGDPNALGRLGAYDVLEVIGLGGMGVVLKGFDRELKRCVAIKVLAPHLAHSSLARKRFTREAQAAAAIVHPNVLAIHQVQPNGRLPYLVMPLVAGESLAQRLASQGTLELKEILRIGMQAAAGLGAAHDQGLVHRDVKPANILLEMGIERAVLTDFGLARAADDVSLTRWGIIAGTPQYMSPEQAKGEPLDGRSDFFSLGCVLYEMATGVSPFRTDSVMATMRRLVDESPQAMASLNPELPPWFIAIVDRLLEKEPPRRFGSAKEVSELLEGCLAHLHQPASVSLPVALPKPAPQSLSGRRKAIFKGAMALFATLGIGLFAWILFSPPERGGEAGEFGPVVDQELNAGHLSDKNFFRFLMGKEPAKSSTKEEKLSDAWFAKQGINASGDRESTAPRLVGLGCVFLRIDEPQAWATLSADAVRSKLGDETVTLGKHEIKNANDIPQAISGIAEIKNPKDLPHAFLFNTVRSDRGILQILSFDPETGIVKIRYKLAWPAKSKPGPATSYRLAMLPQLQAAKAEAALEKLKAEFDRTEAALKAGHVKAPEAQAAKDAMDLLDAELKRFRTAWNAFAAVIDRHKTAAMTHVEFAKEQNEVATAEVRLRVVQAMAEVGDGKASFGPEMERTVPANNQPQAPWFDVDAGRPIFGLSDNQGSADFGAQMAPGQRGLFTADETGFGSISLEEAQWETITPAQLTQKLKSATADSLSGEGALPKTYGFTTRAGGMGVLQIIGYSDEPRGIKIRYKLVRPTADGQNDDLRNKEKKRAGLWAPDIELVALMQYPTEGSPWWTPDGRVLKEPPVDPSKLDIRSAINPKKVWYTALFRIPGGFDSLVSGDSIKRAEGPWIWSGQQYRGSRLADDLAALAIELPADAKQADLAVQVARGTWRTVATVTGKRLRENDTVSESGTDWMAMDCGDGRIRLFVNYPKALVQARVILHRGGQTTFARLNEEASPNDAKERVEARFPELADLDVDCLFTLQTRPYEKVDLRNVVLQPGEPRER